LHGSGATSHRGEPGAELAGDDDAVETGERQTNEDEPVEAEDVKQGESTVRGEPGGVCGNATRSSTSTMRGAADQLLYAYRVQND
jgi:hypothetical protein